MRIDDFKFGASDLASMTQPTQQAQREYRQRGMMEDFGQLVAGRYMYSLRDVVGVWVSDRLSVRGQAMDRRDALRLGKLASEYVITAFRDFCQARAPGVPRFITVYDGGHGELADGAGDVVDPIGFIATAKDVDQMDFYRVEQIDIHRLAATVPANIAAKIQEMEDN